jgi:tetratricopeptide (TPR) repeat protein
MYLKGSKWNMNRRTKRSNPWRIIFLVVLIGGALYLNQFIVPSTTAMFVPTLTPTRNPESFINEAETFFNQGKLTQAIDSYNKAIQADPKNRANYVALARVQVFTNQYDKALENAQRSLVGNSDYALGQAVLGWTLNFTQDLPRAEAALKKALELDPNNALAHAYYAEILANENSPEKAGTESRKALELAPNSLESLRARGFVLYSTGNYKDSLDMYKAAVNINKNIPDLFIYMGYDYKALEDYSSAIDAFLQANALNPADSIPDLEASRVYMILGDFPKAVQLAQNAVSDDPQNPHRYGNLGIALYRKGDYNQAIAAFTLAIRGGTSSDGKVVKGLPLDYGYVSQYFQLYGLSLAKATPNRCSEAIPVFQALLAGVSDDTYAVQNAQAGLQLCQVSIPTPTLTPTPKKR